METNDKEIRQLKNIIKESVKNILSGLKQNKSKSEDFNIEDYWDIDSYSEEQIRSIYTDLSVFIYGNNFGEPLQMFNGKLKVYESSTEHTLPYKEVKEELKKSLHFLDWQIREESGANGIKLILLYSDIGENVNIIIEKMKLMGWSKSYITPVRIINGVPIRAISFDPIYQDSIKDIIRKWRYLYHISPFVNKDSILKNGLIPTSRNNKFDYLPRVHLLMPSLSDNQLRNIARQLYDADNNPDNDGTYCLFQIDVNKLPIDIDFYFDGRYEKGVYTKQIIPRDAIKGCHQFNIFKANLY